MTVFKVLLVTIFVVCKVNSIEETFQWKQLSYAWPSPEAEQAALASGKYIPENNLPLGLARWKDKLFVTVPRWKAGVAATLNYIPLEGQESKSPDLVPYPDWPANTLPLEENMLGDNQIVSTFRVFPDQCDRLWIMDTGLADIFGNATQYAPPAIVVYDLNTNTFLRRYPFKKSDMKEGSFFANIAVEASKDDCDNAFAYVPDLGAYGLVVYSWAQHDSWRVKHNYFHFDPLKGNFNVAGINFQWTDGIFGLALGPTITAGDVSLSEGQGMLEESDIGHRRLFFHALAGTHEFSVSTRVLKNSTLAGDPASYDLYKVEGDKGDNSQATAVDYDNTTDVLFFTQVNRNGIACWNIQTELKPENVALVAEDAQKLIFPNDLRIDCQRNLWVLSDIMPKFLYKNLNSNDINYRIFKFPIDDLINNSICKL